jgi:hypothetical protein
MHSVSLLQAEGIIFNFCTFGMVILIKHYAVTFDACFYQLKKSINLDLSSIFLCISLYVFEVIALLHSQKFKIYL